MTRVLKVDSLEPNPDLIAEAGKIIREGGLVAFPTETVYGLGANALDPYAVQRIFEAKERPANDPIIVHIADFIDLNRITNHAPEVVSKLADKFWPGPLTFVLRRSNLIPDNITAGTDTVAVRMPAHPVALALIKAAAVPIGAPSANRFSRPSATTAQHVLLDLQDRVDLILDAGPTSIGVESTVLSLLEETPTVLRPGGISLEELANHIPNVSLAKKYIAEDQAAPAPGTLLKHYSPHARVMLYDGPLAKVLSLMESDIVDLQKENKTVGVIWQGELDIPFDTSQINIISAGKDLSEMAHNLFACFRELDKQGVDIMMIYMPEESGLGLAIRDRLLRAAEGHVIVVK